MVSLNMELQVDEDDEEFSNASVPPQKFQTLARNFHISRRKRDSENQNIITKLLNRQNTGYFSNSQRKRSHENAFKEIPSQLSFCLKDIVPYCYLEGHIFMGLSACGQFLISYKMNIEYEETITSDYNFSSAYKYELYFWIYRPHCLLSKYYNVCLFDDHGVDDVKTVSMTQWSTDNQILIVHGASEIDEYDNYITVMRVPKLGCLECKQMRDDDMDGNNRLDILCIKCNLTIHAKYRNTDSVPKFNPKYNFNCPGYIIMSENSFIHSINIQLDMNKSENTGTNIINYKYVKNNCNVSSSNSNNNYNCDITNIKRNFTAPTPLAPMSSTSSSAAMFNLHKSRAFDSWLTPIVPLPPPPPSPTLAAPCAPPTAMVTGNASKRSVVEEIIADFAEYEIDSNTSVVGSPYFQRLDRNFINNPHSSKPTANFDELVITYSNGANSNNSVQNAGDEANVNLLNHRKNINYELISSKQSSPTSGSTGGPVPATVATNINTINSNHNKIKLKNSYQLTDSINNPTICNSSTVPNNTNNNTKNTNNNDNNIANNNESIDQFEFNDDVNPKNDIKVEQLAAANAYEFSEDTEKCEKISTFRKRRLADKKYEFSEDNTENIVPFNRIRNRVRSRFPQQQQQSPTTPYHLYPHRSPSLSPSHNSLFNPSPPNYEVTSHLHRASPSHGFRSACGSPVSNRLRSPPGIRSPNYHQRSPSSSNMYHTKSLSNYCFMSSPKSLIKQNNIQVFSSANSPHHLPNSPLTNCDDIPSFLADSFQKAEEIKMNGHHYMMERNTNSCNSDRSAISEDEKLTSIPVFSKKIIKRYVEEDDANSVVTIEEDDCISPGYHASIPIEVHGSCYSPMQLISPASIIKVRCPTVTITQHSFDMETFTLHVVDYLCCENNKKYGILLDSAYELIHVCPLTEVLSCILVVQFTAKEKNNSNNCRNCSNTIDCIHSQRYESRTLFYWNMNTGEWHVIDYGNLKLLYNDKKKSNNNNSIDLNKKKNGRGINNITNNLNAASSSSSPSSSSPSSSGNIPNKKKVNPLKDELIKFTKKMFKRKIRTYDYLQHLRILDSNVERTKKTLKDFKNMIEFYRRPANESSSSSDDSDIDYDLNTYERRNVLVHLSSDSSRDSSPESSSETEPIVVRNTIRNYVEEEDDDDEEEEEEEEDDDDEEVIDNATIRSSNPCLSNIL